MELRDQSLSWISLLLVFLTYCAFGWLVSQSNANLTFWVVEQGKTLDWELKEKIVSVMIHLLAAALILAIAIVLTAPVALLTLFFGNWLRSDINGFIAILLWSFGFVVIINWFDYFVRLLVLLAAAILGKLELQQVCNKNWQIITNLAILCLSGFSLGVLTFYLWGFSS